ncbi:YbhB/YbcL family Raf kinase inhibitor-like protein [Halorientalis brevis]|uniref:YbhB/YbcL family Raf kinase inhibitor-like protein n=1 Tax=Halorientalis brevis TaxID=1126241 RepID=A0ABD6CA51_9EURY|nr:YbhB/YbcL family Raf kinase inhibitor-like protein [Halorientalis brevis]
MADLHLTSPAFGDGERIPDQYGYTAANVNPPLTIENVPEDAESLALIVDDPDAMEPAGKIWDHWLVWNVDPDTEALPEGWSPEETDAVEGQNDYGEHGYGGPNPPDREHTYRFMLYALDTRLDLSAAADKDALQDAMTGHVIADTRLEGTYAPS